MLILQVIKPMSPLIGTQIVMFQLWLEFQDNIYGRGSQAYRVAVSTLKPVNVHARADILHAARLHTVAFLPAFCDCNHSGSLFADSVFLFSHSPWSSPGRGKKPSDNKQ